MIILKIYNKHTKGPKIHIKQSNYNKDSYIKTKAMTHEKEEEKYENDEEENTLFNSDGMPYEELTDLYFQQA